MLRRSEAPRPMVSADPRVVVALDFPQGSAALALADRLDPTRCRLKVGKELFTAGGPALVQGLVRRGFGVFLDLKFHDIPATVAGACRAAAGLGVWMLNVHASGGRAMMEAARDAVATGHDAPKLIAVTLLTSMTDRDVTEVGFSGSAMDVVQRLASLAQSSGLDGVVCSGQEAARLRSACGRGFCLVTPGIRPLAGRADDQKRVMTPRDALAAGADYLVIGRPITQAADPIGALAAINDDIAAATMPPP
jgi:orotidine-5'-phosphate decarboxylase